MTTNAPRRRLRKMRRIAAKQITLTAGTRYIAARPMRTPGRAIYPISIYAHDELGNRLAEPVLVVDGLSYEAANNFLAIFNGPCPYDGREW